MLLDLLGILVVTAPITAIDKSIYLLSYLDYQFREYRYSEYRLTINLFIRIKYLVLRKV